MKEELVNSTVCDLIGVAMFGTKKSFLPNVDWNAVYIEMKEQAVVGLIYHSLSQLPIDEDIGKKWNDICCSIMTKGIRIRHRQSQLVSLFENADIPYVILKGTAAAKYYPDFLLREMGDIDIYVSPAFFEQAKDLMKDNGYQEILDEEYQRHISFVKDKVSIELHRSFATINSKKEKDYVDALLKGCCENRSYTDDDQGQGTFHIPPEKINGIVLLEHIAQHLLSGLGLRQIIDWMMYVKAELDDSAWVEFKEMAAQAGLEKLAQTVTKMCCRNFGLQGNYEWCMAADDEVCDELLSYLFDNGNFGQKNKKISKVIFTENRFTNSSLNYFVTLQKRGENNWNLYKKCKWVRPFAWLYQLLRYAVQVIVNPERINIKKGHKEAKRRRDIMVSLGVYREV